MPSHVQIQMYRYRYTYTSRCVHTSTDTYQHMCTYVLYNAYTCVPVVRPHVHIYYAIYTYIHNMWCRGDITPAQDADTCLQVQIHIYLRCGDIMSGDTYQHIMLYTHNTRSIDVVLYVHIICVATCAYHICGYGCTGISIHRHIHTRCIDVMYRYIST